MAGERGDIVIVGEEPLEESESDASKAVTYSVIARSELDAKGLLASREKVLVGAVYRSYQGEEVDASLVCRSLGVSAKTRPAPLGGLADYRVTARYGKRGAAEAAIGGPAVYRNPSSLESSPVDVDAEGYPIVMPTMEAVDPPLSVQVAREQFTVTFWRQVSDVLSFIATLRPYRGALNSAAWHGAARGSMLCERLEVVEEVAVTGGRWWVQVAGQWQYRPEIEISKLKSKVMRPSTVPNFVQATGKLEGFTALHAARGRRRRNGTDGDGFIKWEPFLDASGQALVDPVLVDRNGERVKPGEDGWVVARKLIDRYADFRSLGI